MIYGLRIWTFVCMLIASVSIQKTKMFPSYTPLWWCHTNKKSDNSFTVVCLSSCCGSNISASQSKNPTLIFPAVCYWLWGAQQISPQRATWENESWPDLPFLTKAMLSFYSLISRWPLSDAGVDSCPAMCLWKVWVWKWILLCNSTCIHNANLFNKRKSQTLTLN